jgi:hypothetical protein
MLRRQAVLGRYDDGIEFPCEPAGLEGFELRRADDHRPAVKVKHSGATHACGRWRRHEHPDGTVDAAFRHRHACARVRAPAHAQPAHLQ